MQPDGVVGGDQVPLVELDLRTIGGEEEKWPNTKWRLQ